MMVKQSLLTCRKSNFKNATGFDTYTAGGDKYRVDINSGAVSDDATAAKTYVSAGNGQLTNLDADPNTSLFTTAAGGAGTDQAKAIANGIKAGAQGDSFEYRGMKFTIPRLVLMVMVLQVLQSMVRKFH